MMRCSAHTRSGRSRIESSRFVKYIYSVHEPQQPQWDYVSSSPTKYAIEIRSAFVGIECVFFFLHFSSGMQYVQCVVCLRLGF